MTGFLRFVGVVNAAIWFGAAIFFTLTVGPAFFSPEMHRIFGNISESTFTYYAGGIAMVVLKRYFILQNVCGVIALLHLFAEWHYLRRQVTRFTLYLLLALLGLGLLGGFWLQPKMQGLRQTKYFGKTQEEKDKASRTFGAWHGTSQVINLVVIAGLLIYLVRLNQPVESVRYGGITKFRG